LDALFFNHNLVKASDNVKVTKVELNVDGRLTVSSTTSPFTTTWNTSSVTKGQHSIKARAYDAAGNNAYSAAVIVTK
jgi:hypothetical protein